MQTRPLPRLEENASPAALSRVAARLYKCSPLLTRQLQRYRPFICPFDRLLPLVPAGTSVLDVGCGAGLFLNLLAASGHTGPLHGLDASGSAIAAAQRAAAQLPAGASVRFECRDATQEWPSASFDVVSLIDVMHHIPPQAQQGVIARVARALAPGGVFIYKDMVARPLWLAGANRLHDLLLARQWIHYAALHDVERWCRDAGLVPGGAVGTRLYCYGHEWLLATKPLLALNVRSEP